jgi:hypothetical protein
MEPSEGEAEGGGCVSAGITRNSVSSFSFFSSTARYMYRILWETVSELRALNLSIIGVQCTAQVVQKQ